MFTARVYYHVSSCRSCNNVPLYRSDVLSCLRGQRVAFIGDEKMKQLFLFFASFLMDEPRVVKDNMVDTPSLDLVIVWLPLL